MTDVAPMLQTPVFLLKKFTSTNTKSYKLSVLGTTISKRLCYVCDDLIPKFGMKIQYNIFEFHSLTIKTKR